jgi:hypothetical protein
MMRVQWLWRVVCFIGGIACALLCSSFLKRITPRPTPPVAVLPDRSASRGPWGTLEALEIPFADKEELAPDRALRLQAPQWFFQDWNEKQLLDFIRSCDLSEEQKIDLCQHTAWQIASNGLVCSPSVPLVRGLGSVARKQIYEVLAKSPSNYSQRYPFRFSPEEFDSRLLATGLAKDKRKVISDLAYSDGPTRCFTDLALLPDLFSPEEINSVLDSLYRLPAYRLRLRIVSDSDIAAVARYWGQGGREEKIRPLLESLTKVRRDGGVSIGIGYLLPSFARLRLNTFPRSWNEAQARSEDCFWTSLNFFNDPPEMRFLDPAVVRQTLQTEFIRVQGHPTFGDLITLTDDAGNAIHACVYIADDFVFTKNGVNPLSPWVLMKIPDMLAFFPPARSRAPIVLRRKTAVRNLPGD